MNVEDDGTISPDDTGGIVGDLFGREGNLLLVNGRVRPTLVARSGLRQRWRIVNAARTRYFQLALDGHEFVRIGGDGGFSEEQPSVERPVLVPGERADLLVVPRGAPGSELTVRWIPYDRGYGTTFNRPEEDLFVLRFANGSSAETSPPPVIERSIEPISAPGATPVDLELTLGKDASGASFMGINGVASWDAEAIPAAVGERQLWTVTNTTDWAHPFHLHGFFFQEVDESGNLTSPREWRDTIDVRVDGSVRLLVEYDDRPGMWMFHCHILDHQKIGMMGMLHLH
jgi:FtsP/CotA-like multicopper oxidase with cupredoxin domain